MHDSYQPTIMQPSDLHSHHVRCVDHPVLRPLIVGARGGSRELLTCSDGTPAARRGDRGATLLPHDRLTPHLTRSATAPGHGTGTVPAMHPRTTPLPPVDLSDPVWTIEHVQRVLRLGLRATRTAVSTTGFPAAFRLNASPTARLYWLREDVLAYFATLASQAQPAVPTVQVEARTRPVTAARQARPAPAVGRSAHRSRAPMTREAALAEIAAGHQR